jgi:hypothetical protein
MLQLKRNGQVVEAGDLTMQSLEQYVRVWNDETSGWSADGTFWSITELPDIIEFSDSREGSDHAAS